MAERPTARPMPRPRPAEPDAPRTARQARLARSGRRRSAPKAPSNPLREGLRLERMPDPAAFVLFGATGDLAHRKVLPALFQLWRTNLLPHDLEIVAVGRRPYTDEAFRAEIRGSLDRFSRVLPVEGAAWEPFAARICYHRGDFGDQALYDGLTARLDELDRERGTQRQPPLLPRDPAVRLRRDHRPARPGRPRPRGPRRRAGAGSSSRSRSGATSTERDPPEPRGRQGLPRVAGLPDRPLPGQGDGPQPARLPLRQRDLRADLEPPLRRPRADHGGRVDRGRAARLVLRGGGRVPRLSSRTTSCSSSPSSPWSRRPPSRRTRCATRR